MKDDRNRQGTWNISLRNVGYAGLLALLLVWWMGHAEGGGGEGKSLVGRLKSMYLSLKARMLGVEQRMDGVEQRMGGVEKQVVDVGEVSKRSKKRAESAEVQAGKAKKRSESAEVQARDAKARAATAENEARAAVQRAHAAEKQAKQANERANQAEQRLIKLQDNFQLKLQHNFQRLQGQLAQQRQAFQAYRKLFAKEEAARIAEEAARIARIKEEAEAPKRKAGEQTLFKVGGVEFKARWIPAGKFMMGSPNSDRDAWSQEKPQREVELTRGFWMMETEVTQAQYKAVMGYNPSKHASCGDTCPVENVSWHEAALFANKLSEATLQPKCFLCNRPRRNAFCEAWGNQGSDYIGCKGWRLPTEAEWEYAARAGTNTPRYGAADRVGWYDGNSGGKTQPVWKKQPNAWGLYDMLGNVWEWVYDGWDSSAYTKLGAVDPVYVADTSSRVDRGGSWDYNAQYLRAAYRGRDRPTERFSSVGFRLLRH